MRTAVVFNFLIESGIIASIGILLMLLARRLLRRPLGSRVLVFGWGLVAVRLLCPLVLPNPLINDIRSPFARDPGIRPIAGQVRVRLEDFFDEMRYLLGRSGNPLEKFFRWLSDGIYSGMLARRLFILWIIGMLAAAAWFAVRWIRQKGEWKRELLPALCCILHWFNPLVWVAWRMFRSDAVLACAEGKGCKPFGMVFAVIASLLLICAFSTGEYVPRIATAAMVPSAQEMPAFPEAPDEASLISYAQELYRLPCFDVDTQDASWETSHHASGWTILMDNGPVTCRLFLMPDGRLIRYDYLDERLYEDSRGSWSSLSIPALNARMSEYALALLDAFRPGSSGWIDGFGDGFKYEEGTTFHHAEITGTTRVYQDTPAPGVYLSMLMEPEMRIQHFWLDTPLVQKLWLDGSDPLPASITETLGSFPAKQDLNGEAFTQDHHEAGFLSAEEALQIAVDHIKTKYGETDASLRRLEIHYGFSAEDESPLWMFDFDTHVSGGLYVDGFYVSVDARTGEILNCFGFNEGNG